ncbi:alpha-L-rhamnosidase [Salmonella enterica]|nr:alpha-L-rhamnosidase [Salmonella enterica]
MSQAMQQHPAIAMTRHPLFLARANALKPHLYSHPVAPTGKIQIHRHAESLAGNAMR